MDFGTGFGIPFDANAVAAAASNVRDGVNPAYTVSDFLTFYPQFGKADPDDELTAVVPEAVIQAYIDSADVCVKQTRYRRMWKMAMNYYVAHFCILWLESYLAPVDGKDAIIEAARAPGIVTSESVDGVSYSLDTSAIMQDLAGYDQWKATSFGVQFASLAKIYGKGGMVVR